MPRIKTIAELRRELAAKQQQVRKLLSQRRKVVLKLAAIDKAIAALAGGATNAGPGRPKKARKKAQRRRKRPNVKPLAECLSGALAKAKGKMRAKELAAAVVKAGYVTKDKSFNQTVAKTLGKDKRFKRVGRGLYVLAK